MALGGHTNDFFSQMIFSLNIKLHIPFFILCVERSFIIGYTQFNLDIVSYDQSHVLFQ